MLTVLPNQWTLRLLISSNFGSYTSHFKNYISLLYAMRIIELIREPQNVQTSFYTVF